MALPTSKITNASSYPQQPNKCYISTKPFNAELLSYSTYMDSKFVTQGSLVTNPLATAAACPSGRVLHANGRFLNVGVHPGVTKYYVGVLDPATQLNGFIDPTSQTFANYNANLPVQYDLGSGADVQPLGSTGNLNIGPATPILVRATATTATNSTLNVTGITTGVITIGALVQGSGIAAGTTITAFLTGSGGVGTYTVSPNTTASASGVAITISGIVLSGGALQAGDAVCGQFNMDGSGTTTVNTSVCTESSIIMLTQTSGVNTNGCVVVPAAGSFTVTGLVTGAFNFLIVN